MNWDAIVVGGGPAGLSAATWLARYRRTVAVLDTGEYRNRWADTVHGFLGSDSTSPMALLDRARADLRRYPSAELCRTRAVKAECTPSGFVITTEDGTMEAARLVLATGVRDRFPALIGFEDHYGIDAHHCPTCDGYEARERRVVAYGWSADVAGFSLTLLDWAAMVTVVTDGRRFEGDERHRAALEAAGVAVVEEAAEELLGRPGALEGVRLRSGRVLPCERLFFTVAHVPGSDLADQLGCERTPEECLVVDQDGLTTIPGVYAAGDITPGMQLVAVAVGKGAAAGVACALSMVDLGLPG